MGRLSIVSSLLLVVSAGACTDPTLSPARGARDAGSPGGDARAECVPERCNDADDDCDGRVDEGIDLDADPSNCGACGLSCNPVRGVGTCEQAACAIGSCDPAFGDCNGDPSDGCEVRLVTTDHCGGCGVACTPDNAVGDCSTGSCQLVRCLEGFGDCNGDPADGCEQPLDSLDHCGACGATCSHPNGEAVCDGGICSLAICDTGYGDCNIDLSDGCEQALVEDDNCGGCGRRCDPDHATAGCGTGSCVIEACDAGWDDCNLSAADGCETSVIDSQTDCGACGNSCSPGLFCAAGSCQTASAVTVSAGGDQTCAVTTTGHVVCWGDNSQGQLGDGTLVGRDAPVRVTGLDDVVDVAVGTQHVCALTSTGDVWCWGDNQKGQLGDGTTVDRAFPVPVPITGATSISAGYRFSCAILADETVRCWGSNERAQLGDGTQVDRATPTGGAGLTEVVEIVTGGNVTCARVRSGAVWCVGDSTQGRRGDGTDPWGWISSTSFPIPTEVVGIDDATHLGFGTAHGCAARASSIECWGVGSLGQLGNGATATQATPVQVVGLGTASSLAGGALHSCAITGGTTHCWGQGVYGQLGDGSDTRRLTPVTVTGLDDAVAITAGTAHTCALRDRGRIACWGDNTDGQLGDGTTVQRSTPAAVLGFE